MIWKRLNDHGKNWRHVYKALVLLEYLIKTGSEKVGKVLVMPHSVYRQVLCHVQFSDKFYATFSFQTSFMSRSVLKDVLVGGPAVQGEHFRNPDLEGLPVCGGEQGPGTECEGEGQGHGVPS